MYDTFSIYHFEAETKKICLMQTIKFEHGFISKKYLRSCLFSLSKEIFEESKEDPENKIYMLDDLGNSIGYFLKKDFLPNEEPFDSDKEPDVDFNGEWN